MPRTLEGRAQGQAVGLCGVSQAGGVLFVQHELPAAAGAAAAPAPDADDGADSLFDAASDTLAPMVPHDRGSDFGSEVDARSDCGTGPIPVVHDALSIATHDYDTRCLTHKPARNKDCADCVRGKTRSRRELVGALVREAAVFAMC